LTQTAKEGRNRMGGIQNSHALLLERSNHHRETPIDFIRFSQYCGDGFFSLQLTLF
jgi:hypothetical protein